MRVPIEMQRLAPDMEHGTVVAWLVDVGEAVDEEDPLLEVETDKANVEMVALEAGILVEVVHGPGAEVAVGEVLGYLETAAT